MSNVETARSYNLNQIEHELNPPLPQKFLKGPDVVTATSIELPALIVHTKTVHAPIAKRSLSVVFTPDSIPGINYLSYDDFIRYDPYVCFRSRLAQLGLHTGEIFRYSHTYLTEEIFDELKHGQNVPVEMGFYNFSKRPLIIPENISLFRIVINNARRLEGPSLEKAFEEQRIQIGEIPFRQLKKIFDINARGWISGVKIPVNPDSWRWIGPRPQNEPIDISKLPDDYRKYIESLQVSLNDYFPTEPTLLIGKTLYPVTINDSKITGFIPSCLPGYKSQRNYDDKGVQLFSNVFDGGTRDNGSKKTDWPAIVEHVCGYNKIKNLERYIQFFFFEDQE